MKNVQVIFSQRQWLPALAFAGALAACGGGGGGGGDSGGGAGPTSLALSGTAATGAAIAGQTVDIKCATGTGSAVTQASGTFSVSINGGALPCVLRVTAADGTVLHSVATGSAASAVANLTPLTQLVVAALTAADPDALYSGFSANTASVVTAGNVAAAIALVVNKLAPVLDLSTIGNLLTANLVAANGTTEGNAYDVALDSLKAFLADGGTTIVQFTQSVIAEKQVVDDPGIASGTVSVPAELLLRPAASNCSALRSGSYRATVLKGSGPGVESQMGTIVLNATTLGFFDVDFGVSSAFIPTGPCQFTEAPDKATDISVSQAGVMVFRSVENGAPRLGIAFPKQTHALAALAGSWNMLGLRNRSASYAPDAGSMTLNANGVSTASSYCADIKTCIAQTNVITVSPQADGGFTWTENGGVGRLYAYRAGGGEMILVSIAGDGTFLIWTRQRALALPTVGSTGSSWDYEVNSQSAIPAVPFVSSTTILSADAATGVFTRQAVVTPGVTRVETLIVNNPRPGYRLRNAATVPTSNGGTSNVRESIAMNLRGTGLTASAFPAAASFLLSVTQPPP